MKKVIVVGSLNVDMVAKVTKIPMPGETISCDFSEEFFGGKGANQAYAVAKAGVEVSMIGKVGNDENGRKVIENLKKVGVDTENIKITDEFHTGYAFITVDAKAENSIVVVKGANQNLLIDDINDSKEALDSSDIVLIQQEIPKETIEYVINYAHEKGKTIILNPAPAKQISGDILAKVSLITPNRTELGILIGKNVEENEKEIRDNLIELADTHVKEIILTLGSDGVLHYKDGKIAEYKSYNVKPMDTTGAGDCFNGYLAASLALGKTLDESIDNAQKAAAISITKMGAQSSTPSYDEMTNNQLKKQC